MKAITSVESSIINHASHFRHNYVKVIVSVNFVSTPSPSVDYESNPVCANVTTCDDQSTHLTPSPTADIPHTPSVVAPSSANPGICMPGLDREDLGLTACLGVTIPTTGFVLILIILFICCVGIYVCQRKKTKQKGKQNV